MFHVNRAHERCQQTTSDSFAGWLFFFLFVLWSFLWPASVRKRDISRSTRERDRERVCVWVCDEDRGGQSETERERRESRGTARSLKKMARLMALKHSRDATHFSSEKGADNCCRRWAGRHLQEMARRLDTLCPVLLLAAWPLFLRHVHAYSKSNGKWHLFLPLLSVPDLCVTVSVRTLAVPFILQSLSASMFLASLVF